MNEEPLRWDVSVSAEQSQISLEFGEIWRYRDMLLFMVLRDFKIRFKQSLFGISWAFFQPALTMIIFSLVFGSALNVRFPGPYPLYFYCGLLPWNAFSKVLTGATMSVVTEAELIRKVYFPRLVLPLSQVFSCLSDFAISFILLLLMMAWYGVTPSIQMLWMPCFLLLAIAFALAFSLWLAPLNVRFRDIQIGMPLFIQSLMILSPLIYPAQKFAGSWMWLYELNPLVTVIDGFRWCILGTDLIMSPSRWCSLLVVLFFLISGAVVFRQSQKKFADII